MRLKLIYEKLFMIFILLSLFIFSCATSNVGDGAEDPAGNIKLVASARAFTYGCPSYFYPPEPYVSRPAGFTETKCDKGNATWTPNRCIFDDDVITKDKYIRRLNKATIEKQESYSQYQRVEGSGFPGYSSLEYMVYYPTDDYHNGYVCYTYVYRAMRDAGFNINIPGSPEDIVENMRILSVSEIDQGYVYPGDIICYDFDPNQLGYEHIGIVTETNGNKENWKVISSIGIIEHFKYGVYEHRLEIFGTSPRGDFSTWDQDLTNYTWDIYAN